MACTSTCSLALQAYWAVLNHCRERGLHMPVGRGVLYFLYLAFTEPDMCRPCAWH